ncbi:MAG: hypothetical protein ACK456_08875 [Pseudanabaenaceae cyanobacterium]|jgi:hypothetical protein
MRAITNPNEPNQKPKAPQSPRPWRKWVSLLVAIALAFYLTACGESEPKAKTDTPVATPTKVTEVAPPIAIQKLARQMEKYEPKLSILSPKSDEILTSNEVSVKFAIQNLPIFKSGLGLGPHVHVALDSQEYQAVYDINQPIVFDHLTPGTHTLRAFASRPWHESFKNNGAYAQLTFHVLTKTNENTPDPKLPLLTYSRPVGTYGAEPIMLDFYLHNAPLHLAAQSDTKVGDWQVRATLNGQTFTFDQWQPVYLKGFRPGQNWVKLELIDTNGALIPNVFNSSAHVINYQPGGQDTLAKLVRDESITDLESVVNPDYVPPTPTPVPSPIVSPVPSPAASPVASPAVTTPVTTTTTKAVAPVVVPVVVPVAPAAVSSPAATTPAVPTATPEPTATPRKKVILRKATPVTPAVEAKSEAKPAPVTPVKTPAKNPVVPVATPAAKVEVKSAPVKPAEPVTAPKTEPNADVKSTANPVIVPVKVAPPAKIEKVEVKEVKPVTAPVAQPVVKSAPVKPAVVKPIVAKPVASPASDNASKASTKPDAKAAPESEPKATPTPKAAPVLTTKPKLEFKVEKRSEFTPAPKSEAPVQETAKKEAPKVTPSADVTPVKPGNTNYFWEQLQQRLHPESAAK